MKQASFGDFDGARSTTRAVDIDDYGPTSRRPVPVAEHVDLAGTDRDARELAGTGLAPGDFEILNGKCGPETAKRLGFHPDDEHREDHYPDGEEAAISADLADQRQETTDMEQTDTTDSNASIPKHPSNVHTEFSDVDELPDAVPIGAGEADIELAQRYLRRALQVVGHHDTTRRAIEDYHRDDDRDPLADRCASEKAAFSLSPDQVNRGRLKGGGGISREEQASAVIDWFESEHPDAAREAKQEYNDWIREKCQSQLEEEQANEDARAFLADPPEEVNGWQRIPDPHDDALAVYQGVRVDTPSVVVVGYDDEGRADAPVFTIDDWRESDGFADYRPRGELRPNTWAAVAPESIEEAARGALSMMRQECNATEPGDVPPAGDGEPFDPLNADLPDAWDVEAHMIGGNQDIEGTERERAEFQRSDGAKVWVIARGGEYPDGDYQVKSDLIGVPEVMGSVARDVPRSEAYADALEHIRDHPDPRPEPCASTDPDETDEPNETDEAEAAPDGGRDPDRIISEAIEAARDAGIPEADIQDTLSEHSREIAAGRWPDPDEAAEAEAVPDGGEAAAERPEPSKRRVVYTAPGLDGAIHRVTATNRTWNVDVARQFAAADLRDRTGGLPSDVADIEILDVREIETDGGTIASEPDDTPGPDDTPELPGAFDRDEETVGDGWEGEYLYTSWGYGQTNVEMATIIDVSDSGKTVLARLVVPETVDTHRTSERLRPSSEEYGDEFRLHVRGYSNDDTPSFRGSYPYVNGDSDDGTRRGSFRWFEDVAGDSVHQTATGYGH